MIDQPDKNSLADIPDVVAEFCSIPKLTPLTPNMRTCLSGRCGL